MNTNINVKTEAIIKQKTKDTWQRELVRKRKKKKEVKKRDLPQIQAHLAK